MKNEKTYCHINGRRHDDRRSFCSGISRFRRRPGNHAGHRRRQAKSGSPADARKRPHHGSPAPDFETLGAAVTWNQAAQQATIQTAAYTVVFTIGSSAYTVNGLSKTLDSPAILVNSRTLVPFRAFAEAIGAVVDYNNATRTVTVDYFTTMSGNLTISGSTTVFPIAQAAADKLRTLTGGKFTSDVSGGGSGAGINAARGGTVNLGMSSRVLTAAELTELTAYTVALDAIAIIVHPSNPVKELTMDQVAKIFSGEYTNWNQVGGNNAPILVQTRETGSGTLDALQALLGITVKQAATPHNSSTLILRAVANDVNAIGFDSIGFLDSTVKGLVIGGVEPKMETVLDGTYKMQRYLYICSKGEASGLAAKFIDYLRSIDCQDNIVEKEGYVKLPLMD